MSLNTSKLTIYVNKSLLFLFLFERIIRQLQRGKLQLGNSLKKPQPANRFPLPAAQKADSDQQGKRK